MITIITHKINPLNQKSYNNFLKTICISNLTCSCGFSGCLIRHGYYNRSIKTPDGIISLSFLRVKCKHCGKTHAILPDLIVPYSQVILKDHISIINAYLANVSFETIMLDNEYIDESNISYIITKYLKYWKERIASFGFLITSSINTLSTQCLLAFKRQFMQIKCVTNIPFFKPT